MPKPTSNAKAPKNASTDTATGGKKKPTARQTTKTSDGKGVAKRGSGEWENNPYVGRAGVPVTSKGPADNTGSYGATHAYDFYDEDHQDRVEGRENRFYPLRGQASDGKGGTVGKRRRDHFLEGFNSEDSLMGHKKRYGK